MSMHSTLDLTLAIHTCIVYFVLHSKWKKESCDKTLNIAKSTFVHQCKRQSNFGDEYLRALHSRAEDSMETAPSWEVVMWRQALQQLPHWTPSHLPPGSNYPLFHFILHHCLCLSCCFGPRYRYQDLLSYWTQSPSHPPTPCFEPKPFLIFSLQKMRENAKQRTKNGNRANRFFFLSLQIFW